jgi:hypothetical protein
MATKDLIAGQFNVGDVVNVPCVVTAIGGTAAQPALTLTTKYPGFNGSTDSISVDAVQVITDK